MPHRDKLKDLEKQLDRLGLGDESKGVKSLKMKMGPVELAMALGLLGPGSAPSDEEGLEDFDYKETEEDLANDGPSDNDDFDFAHFGLGPGTKQDRQSAAEKAKEQHKRHVGGMRVKAQFELDQLLELIDDCRAEGDQHGELEDLYSKLRLAQLLFKKYDAEYHKLNKPKRVKPTQSDDARDPMLDVVPTKYKYKIGQAVTVYETPHDTFPAVITNHRLDIKTNLKMYKVLKQGGDEGWFPEFRIQVGD
jgi:hypothetical protein